MLDTSSNHYFKYIDFLLYNQDKYQHCQKSPSPSTSIVNRLPDVIKAAQGFITTDKMGELQFRTESLEKYV